MRKPFVVYVLVIVLVFQALTALVPATMLMFDPSGRSVQFPSYVIDKMPFANFFVPALLLFTCLGVLPLFTVYHPLSRTDTQVFKSLNIYRDYRFGWMLSLFCGFATLIWITTQLYMIETCFWLQTFYAAVGLLVLALTLLPRTMHYYRIVR